LPGDGSSLAAKTILLFAEQGCGDTLQFVRFAQVIKQMGCRAWSWSASRSL
jgi:hypothetical protein